MRVGIDDRQLICKGWIKRFWITELSQNNLRFWREAIGIAGRKLKRETQDNEDSGEKFDRSARDEFEKWDLTQEGSHCHFEL